MDIIETERCQLTSLQADDLEDVVGLYSNPEVRRYLGGPVDAEKIRSDFLLRIESEAAMRQWAIRLRRDEAFVGIIYLGPHHDGGANEVSYQLLPKWWGQGYASETVRAVIDYAWGKLGLSQVVAETQSANIASCRLLEGLGFHREKTVERFGAEQAIYLRKK